MTDESTAKGYSDRYGLGFGKIDSGRRKALADPETGQVHEHRLSDAAVARRIADGAFEIMRIYSREGRVFISHDAAIQLSIVINAISMSQDSIALFDGAREGRLTAKDVKDLMSALSDAADKQRKDAVQRAEAEAQADADYVPGSAGRAASADGVKQ